MPSFHQIQGIDYTLSGSGVSSSATSVGVIGLRYPDGTPIVTADLGTAGIGYGTFEPETSREENFSFTGITDNGNDSFTLTGVTRGLGFKFPYASDVSLRLPHSGSTVLRLSNSAPFYEEFAVKRNDNAFTGDNTFSNLVAMPTGTSADLNKGASIEFVVNTAVAGAPDASLVGKGLVQLPTQAQTDARTATGSTGAALAVTPNVLRATKYVDFLSSATGNDSYAITPVPAVTALADGMEFTFEADVANTGTATLNVAALGAKTIRKYGSKTLDTNDLAAGSIVKVVYDLDSDSMLLQTPVAKQQMSQDSGEVYAASATGNDSYAITVIPPITAYTAGMSFKVKADVGNTGPATLSVSGLSALSIRKGPTLTLETGDIVANQVFEVVHDGSVFQMTNVPPPITNVAIVPFPAVGTVAASTVNFNSSTVAHGGAFILPSDISVNKVSFNVSTFSANDTLDIAVYSESGQAQVFSVTTANVTGTGIVSTAVSSVYLKSGKYYLLAVNNGGGAFTVDAWTAVVGSLNNVASEPVLQGNIAVSAGALPATFLPTGLTAGASDLMIFRLDN